MSSESSPPPKRRRIADDYLGRLVSRDSSNPYQAALNSPALSQQARSKRASAIEAALQLKADSFVTPQPFIGTHSSEINPALFSVEHNPAASRSRSPPVASHSTSTSYKNEVSQSHRQLQELRNTSIRVSGLFDLSDDPDLHSTEGHFINLNNACLLAPSSKALEEARLRLGSWEKEINKELLVEEDRGGYTAPIHSQSQLSAKLERLERHPLTAIENQTSVELPTFSRPDNHSNSETPTTPVSIITASSILVDAATSNSYTSCATPVVTFSSPKPRTPSRTLEFQPMEPKGVVRSGTISSRLTKTPARTKFRTPFKTGVSPAAPIKMHATHEHPAWVQTSSISHLRMKAPVTLSCKTSLRDSGLRPRTVPLESIRLLGIDVDAISQVDPSTAQSSRFPIANIERRLIPCRFILPPTVEYLDIRRARDALIADGYAFASQKWVDNAWSLLVWKLAGLALLDPVEEAKWHRWWHWMEIMNQLHKRYEREFNTSFRSPLHRIVTRDAPPSSPMILCISSIKWCQAPSSIARTGDVPSPAIEVTDGWYRMKVRVDQPLARAALKRHLRVGMKIACQGARLDCDRKEPSDILDSYESTRLVLGGNSTHLAKWHAKLGYRKQPFLAAMRSLSPDGGLVSLICIVVVKIFPLAFVEFLESGVNKLEQRGPWSERDEADEEDKWKRKREEELSKLHQESENKYNKLEKVFTRLEQLEQLAKNGHVPNPYVSGQTSNSTEDLLEMIEAAEKPTEIIQALTPSQVTSLKSLVQCRLQSWHESARVEIESELESICPARRVKSFRIMRVKDACTSRRTTSRNAQLTIWNAQAMFSEEDSPGLHIGSSYLVTNVQPIHQTAWMRPDEVGSEIYLATRPNSRFFPY